eukprot:428706_1
MLSGLFRKKKNKLLWKKLKQVPFPVITNVIPLDDKEFILGLQTYDNERHMHETEGFYKYNTKKDKYFVFIDTRIDDDIGSETFSFDYDNNILYSIDTFNRKLIKYDLKSKTKRTHSFTNFIGLSPVLFVIDRKLHIFGGSTNYHHLILDCNSILKNLTFVENFRLGNRGRVQGPGGIYVRSQNMLLMLGGLGRKKDTEQCHIYNTIWKYSLITNKWKLFPVKLPLKMIMFGCVLSLNERYIITLCGIVGSDDKEIDDIFVIDLYEKNVKKSKIKCPFKGRSIAVVMHNKHEKHEILITSFCRRIANNDNIPSD